MPRHTNKASGHKGKKPFPGAAPPFAKKKKKNNLKKKGGK